MSDIFGLIVFSYLFFAVIGLQIFNGPYIHTRCRLTPFPVTLSFQNMVFDTNTTIEAFERYRCLNASNVDYPGQSPDYTKASSPWSMQAVSYIVNGRLVNGNFVSREISH